MRRPAAIASLSTSASLAKFAVRVTALLRLFGQRRLWTHPNDIVERIIFTEERVFTRIGVENAGKFGVIQAKKVEKRTVLAERKGVTRIVGRRFMIARKQNQSAANTFAQSFATKHIRFCFKHGDEFVGLDRPDIDDPIS